MWTDRIVWWIKVEMDSLIRRSITGLPVNLSRFSASLNGGRRFALYTKCLHVDTKGYGGRACVNPR